MAIGQEARADRARNLGTLNGMDFVLVDLPPAPAPVEASLELHFLNTNGLAAIVAEVMPNPASARNVFPITGGHRILAGPATGQVQVTGVAAGPDAATLMLTVAPIGDYSTYTLSVSHSSGAPPSPD